jgi:hypothetical protein
MEDELLSRSRELRIVSQGEGAYAQEEESLIPSPKRAFLKLSTLAQFRNFASIATGWARRLHVAIDTKVLPIHDSV